MSEPIPETLITHTGVFHADDVLCAAMLLELNPDLKVSRVTNREISFLPKSDHTLVADVGFGRFDHHQNHVPMRADGRKHAACGLVWQAYADHFEPRGPEEARLWEKTIEAVEDADNGSVPKDGHSPMSSMVSCSNPNWDESISRDERFMEVAHILQQNVVHTLLSCEPPIPEAPRNASEVADWIEDAAQAAYDRREASKERARSLVFYAIDASDGHTLVLDTYMPWAEPVCEHNQTNPDKIERVVFPSLRGGYNVQAVPIEPNSFELVRKLDKSWLETPPKGCTFVHQALFISAFDTRENALSAVATERAKICANESKSPITDFRIADEVPQAMPEIA